MGNKCWYIYINWKKTAHLGITPPNWYLSNIVSRPQILACCIKDVPFFPYATVWLLIPTRYIFLLYHFGCISVFGCTCFLLNSNEICRLENHTCSFVSLRLHWLELANPLEYNKNNNETSQWKVIWCVFFFNEKQIYF